MRSLPTDGIDGHLCPRYILTMETAISLPDKVYLEAEKMAQSMGVSRNALYSDAITEYLKRNARANITQRLDEIYADDYDKEFEPISNAGLEGIRELTKNDSW